MTSSDKFLGQESQCIEHLMRIYHWGRFEAQCYFYYEPFDPIDWVDYE